MNMNQEIWIWAMFFEKNSTKYNNWFSMKSFFTLNRWTITIITNSLLRHNIVLTATHFYMKYIFKQICSKVLSQVVESETIYFFQGFVKENVVYICTQLPSTTCLRIRWKGTWNEKMFEGNPLIIIITIIIIFQQGAHITEAFSNAALH